MTLNVVRDINFGHCGPMRVETRQCLRSVPLEVKQFQLVMICVYSVYVIVIHL
jgi:hypothetical protein